MPHFDKDGNEEWVCQMCGKVKTGESTWMTPVPGKKFNGNVCKDCLNKAGKKESVINRIDAILNKKILIERKLFADVEKEIKGEHSLWRKEVGIEHYRPWATFSAYIIQRETAPGWANKNQKYIAYVIQEGVLGEGIYNVVESSAFSTYKAAKEFLESIPGKIKTF